MTPLPLCLKVTLKLAGIQATGRTKQAQYSETSSLLSSLNAQINYIKIPRSVSLRLVLVMGTRCKADDVLHLLTARMGVSEN